MMMMQKGVFLSRYKWSWSLVYADDDTELKDTILWCDDIERYLWNTDSSPVPKKL